MTVAIFPARASHALGIHDLFATVAAERIHLLRDDAPSIEEIYEGIDRCVGDGGVYLVACDGDKVVGSIVVVRMRRTGCHHVGTLGMMVHREYRGRGFGTQLLQAALEECGRDGIWRVELSVYPRNTAAVKIYHAAGFEEEGRTIRGRLFDGVEDAFLDMALLLESRPRQGSGPKYLPPRKASQSARATSVEIVPVELRHAAELRAMVDKVARERRWIAMVNGPDLATTKEFIKKNLQEGNPHLVATDGDTVVGGIDITRMPRKGQRHIGGLGMCLDFKYRGMGLGGMLLESALAWSAKEGLLQIHLDFWASNSAAKSLYLKHEFKLVRCKRRMRVIDGYEDDLIGMQKMLDE